MIEALEEVRYAGDPPPFVTVVDPEQADELLAVDERRFWMVANLNTPLLAASSRSELRFGIDRADVETAVTVMAGDEDGMREYGVWTGDFDATAITAELAADGFTEHQADGGALWANASGDEFLRVSDEELVWGGQGFDPAMLTEGRPLSEEPRYRELSACVDGAYRVDFTHRDSDEEGVTAYAVGQVAEFTDDASDVATSEVLCLGTRDAAEAERATDALEQTVADNEDRYGGSEVTLLEGEPSVVRVTVPHLHEGQEPGWLIREDAGLITRGLG
ncbi:hypothetical protein [Streptomyces sp. 8K308]|uniref:hypothetical protein n=1 Tax=Streptomyces sp. 8K308 TaxID=2530388 RepID=UPI00140523BE|nr:hypothetical protein [Streptomyces sp. 8K308]